MSASFPASSDPELASRRFTYADPSVKARSAVARSRHWSGRKTSSCRRSGLILVTATSISSSGLGVDTPQSLPKASFACARCKSPNRYSQAARSSPRNGIVSSKTCGDAHAQNVWQFATTSRAAKRGTSSGPIIWTCAM